MELGKATVRTTGVNLLTSALHPSLGLIWTDGRGLHVAPVSVAAGRLASSGRVRLGEFEAVQAVHWSAVEESGSCYLCVVHPQAVTVWRVQGTLPRPNFKQVRKINIQVLSQGCLWNPACEVLCLLTRQQCSFYYGHQGQRGSFAFPPLESGRISAACWSPDGSRLVVCTSSVLLIYTWPDIGKSVSDVTPMAWKIPSVSGNITAVVPVNEDCFVCSVEPAPESFCKTSDAFIVPDGKGPPARQTGPSSPLVFERAPEQQGALSQLVMVRLRGLYQDPVRAASTTIPGILSPDLLVFEEWSQSVVVGSNSRDRLLLFSCHGELVHTQEVVLGSRERPKGVCGWPASDGGGGGGLLVMTGEREPGDEAFPSTSTSSQYALTLKFFPIHLGVPASVASLPGRQRPSLPSTGRNVRELMRTQSERTVSLGRHRADISPPPTISEKEEAGLSLPKEESHMDAEEQDAYTSADIDDVLDELLDGAMSTHTTKEANLMNGGPGVSTNRRPLIEELNSDPSEKTVLETEKVCFSDVEPLFKNPSPADFEPGQQTHRLAVAVDQVPRLDLNGRSSSRQDSPHGSVSSQSAWSSNSPVLARNQGGLEEPRQKNSSPLSVHSNGSSHSSHCLRDGGTERDCGLHSEQQSVVSTRSERLSKDDSVARTGFEQQVNKQSNDAAQQTATRVPPPSQSAPTIYGLAQTTHGSEQSTERSIKPKHGHGQVGHVPTKDLHVRSGGDHDDAGLTARETGRTRADPQGCTAGRGQVGRRSSGEEDESLQEMEELLQTQTEQIAALQERVAQLSRLVDESSCVVPSRYQKPDTPELVHITCEQLDGTSKKRTFVLDQGRVQFEPVRRAFGLSTVELILDGEPCVVGPNIDGYIPMRFQAGSSVHITGLAES